MSKKKDREELCQKTYDEYTSVEQCEKEIIRLTIQNIDNEKNKQAEARAYGDLINEVKHKVDHLVGLMNKIDHESKVEEHLKND